MTRGQTEQMRPQPDHGESSYIGHNRLAGRRALITGGDSGIGRAVAIAFASIVSSQVRTTNSRVERVIAT